MSINLANVAPTVRKKRARKSGESRASQKLYVARFQNEVYLVSKDRGACDAEIAKQGKGSVKEYGSRRALPPSVTLAVFKKSPTLAGVFAGLGGNWGTLSQNEQNRESIAKHLRGAFDALNKARRMERKEPLPLPTIGEGEWHYVTTTTQKVMSGAEIDDLNALADEFGDMFGTEDDDAEINEDDAEIGEDADDESEIEA